MIRLVIADDQRLMREGLRTLLATEADMDVVALAGDGLEAVRLATELRPNVILMDIRMPEQDGILATRTIRATHPDIRILMLTTYDDREDVTAALAAGAHGYLLKDMPAEAIMAGIRAVYQGAAVLPPALMATALSEVPKTTRAEATRDREPLASKETLVGLRGQCIAACDQTPATTAAVPASTRPDPLTKRELDVLRHIARGLSNREIAAAMCVTEGTVKNHVSNLIAKLGVRDRTQAALYAIGQGYGPSTS